MLWEKPRTEPAALGSFLRNNMIALEEEDTTSELGIAIVYVDGIGGPDDHGRERTSWKWFEWHPDSDDFRECADRED